jgi:CubicO group peptidase (beta-lactamase class C family)
MNLKSMVWRAAEATLVLSAMFCMTHASAATDPLPRADPARVGFSAAALERIDRFFNDQIAKDQIPGAVIGIAREGRLVYYKAIGFQDKGRGSAMRTDSIFQLASMTKPMVVVGALTLYEEGKLPLKSSLETYFPQFKSIRWALWTVAARSAMSRRRMRSSFRI